MSKIPKYKIDHYPLGNGYRCCICKAHAIGQIAEWQEKELQYYYFYNHDDWFICGKRGCFLLFLLSR